MRAVLIPVFIGHLPLSFSAADTLRGNFSPLLQSQLRNDVERTHSLPHLNTGERGWRRRRRGGGLCLEEEGLIT